MRSVMLTLLILALFGEAPEAALAAPPATDRSFLALREQLTAKAINYLAAKGQAEDGSFSAAAGPGVTALVATALLRNGRRPDDPLVAQSLAYLTRFIRPDGGVYQKNSLYRNYETCLAIMCFSAANSDGRYDRILRRAKAFVKEAQWDEGEGTDVSDPSYGGAGYGKHKRPDLSNTAFFVEALATAGEPSDSEAIQRALVFVSRCQNLESPYNTTPFSAKNPDGGFYYTPAAGGQSQAGAAPNGGLRSYGSMTYAGLKSMIYAGVDRQDPRVQAAVKWIREHYDVRSNPGMGDAGLYYYYHTFAKALDAFGENVLTDANGVRHDWRRELVEELARRQRPDGSWINPNDRWFEGDANLVTGYVLLALAHCRPDS